MDVVWEKIAQLGYELPSPSPPVGNYLPLVVSNDIVHISGQLPMRDGVLLHPGKVDSEVTMEHAREAAAHAMLSALSVFYARFNGFENVAQFLHVRGYVNATAQFTQHSAVVDGASALVVSIFGDRGRHARAAIGAHSLPRNASVEIECMIRIVS